MTQYLLGRFSVASEAPRLLHQLLLGGTRTMLFKSIFNILGLVSSGWKLFKGTFIITTKYIQTANKSEMSLAIDFHGGNFLPILF